MDQRLKLQALLELILGSRNVYFQPPESLKIKYPAIVYARDDSKVDHADNSPYRRTKRYLVTCIDSNPDSETPDRVEELPCSSFVRHFTADNLNHDLYNVYF